MSSPVEFKHELAAWIPPGQSSSVSFIGVFDQGRKITIANRKGDKAYVYDLGSANAVTPVAFCQLLKGSLGRYWGEVKKKHDLSSSMVSFDTYDVQAGQWYNDSPTPIIPQLEWCIGGGDCLYAF